MQGPASRLPRRRAGFTLAEVLVAITVAMILLFGTLYSASETVGVVQEGDQRLHSEMLARNTLDRMLGDCRYAFNTLQLTTFPYQYKPPVGTYGSSNT